MTNKITLGLVGIVLVLSVYNTVKISNLKIENVIEQPNRSNVVANPNMENLKPKGMFPERNASNTVPNKIQQPVQANAPQTLPISTGPTTSMRFKEEVHDFGNVDVETENSYSFEFTNTGTEPLTITNAVGSCGCTVPDWPKHPIKPNETATIDVVYRPNKGQAGAPQEKTVTVTANTDPANTVVKIKAFVNPAK